MTEPAAPVCANCQAVLQGPYCHACGQKAHLHHKLSHLLTEIVEGIAHFDGRLWRTLPVLAFNPGRLSREWRAGKRMTYVPPLHIFLFAVFLVFLIPSLTGRHLVNLEPRRPGEPALTVQFEVGNRPSAAAKRLGEALGGKLQQADYYGYKIETLAYKLSFLVAPLFMGILWLLLAWPRRGFTLYDHAVVSLYGIGFLALLAALGLLLPAPVGGWFLIAAGALAPVHAVWHLKGAYGLSWTGAVTRGLLLGVFGAAAFTVFVLGVVALGLAG